LLKENAPSLEVDDAEFLLHSYAAAGHLQLVRVLLEADVCSVNARREEDGNTALHIAEYHLNTDVTHLLVESRADRDALNNVGETPAQARLARLKKLTTKPRDTKLLKENAPSLEVDDAEFLLHSYAAAGHLQLVRVLLEADVCSVNARREEDGNTALHIAEYHLHTDVTRLLMGSGADPDALNNFGETPAQARQAASAAPTAQT